MIIKEILHRLTLEIGEEYRNIMYDLAQQAGKPPINPNIKLNTDNPPNRETPTIIFQSKPS